jgi:ParB-like chromosome segregation protein Spo0J
MYKKQLSPEVASEAAISEGASVTDVVATETSRKEYRVPLDWIKPNPYLDVREKMSDGLEDLILSIQAQGLLKSIVVFMNPFGDPATIWHNLTPEDGHRRFNALRAILERGLAIQGVPYDGFVNVTVDMPTAEEGSTYDEICASRAVRLLAHNSGKPFETVEAAKIVRRYYDGGMTQDAIAAIVGCSRPWINSLLSLSGLSDEALAVVTGGKMSPTTAAAVGNKLGSADASQAIVGAAELAKSEGGDGKVTDTHINTATQNRAGAVGRKLIDWNKIELIRDHFAAETEANVMVRSFVAVLSDFATGQADRLTTIDKVKTLFPGAEDVIPASVAEALLRDEAEAATKAAKEAARDKVASELTALKAEVRGLAKIGKDAAKALSKIDKFSDKFATTKDGILRKKSVETAEVSVKEIETTYNLANEQLEVFDKEVSNLRATLAKVTAFDQAVDRELVTPKVGTEITTMVDSAMKEAAAMDKLEEKMAGHREELPTYVAQAKEAFEAYLSKSKGAANLDTPADTLANLGKGKGAKGSAAPLPPPPAGIDVIG